MNILYVLRAGKVDKINFSRFGIPRLKGEARDIVTIIRRDSSNASKVIEDSHSKGSIILKSEKYWLYNLPSGIDAPTLLACWPSSSRAYHRQLDDVFLPLYPEIGQKLPPVLLRYYTSASERAMNQEGLIYCSPKTLVVGLIYRTHVYGRLRYAVESIIYSLRRQAIKPIFVSKETHFWAEEVLRKLDTEYLARFVVRYNRLLPECPIDLSDPDYDIAKLRDHLQNLAFPATTLYDLAQPLQNIHEAWPYYSLYAANCDLFSRTIRSQKLWFGYMTTNSKRRVEISRLRNGMYILMAILFGIMFLAIVETVILAIVVATWHRGTSSVPFNFLILVLFSTGSSI